MIDDTPQDYRDDIYIDENVDLIRVAPDRDRAREFFRVCLDLAYRQGRMEGLEQEIRRELDWPDATAEDIACYVREARGRH
jgi:hypothetical protein